MVLFCFRKYVLTELVAENAQQHPHWPLRLKLNFRSSWETENKLSFTLILNRRHPSLVLPVNDVVFGRVSSVLIVVVVMMMVLVLVLFLLISAFASSGFAVFRPIGPLMSLQKFLSIFLRQVWVFVKTARVRHFPLIVQLVVLDDFRQIDQNNLQRYKFLGYRSVFLLVGLLPLVKSFPLLWRHLEFGSARWKPNKCDHQENNHCWSFHCFSR